MLVCNTRTGPPNPWHGPAVVSLSPLTCGFLTVRCHAHDDDDDDDDDDDVRSDNVMRRVMMQHSEAELAAPP